MKYQRIALTYSNLVCEFELFVLQQILADFHESALFGYPRNRTELYAGYTHNFCI